MFLLHELRNILYHKDCWDENKVNCFYQMVKGVIKIVNIHIQN